jgi:hypothetical protein
MGEGNGGVSRSEIEFGIPVVVLIRKATLGNGNHLSRS